MRTFLFFILFFIASYTAAQPEVNVYADIGKNNVSEGLFIKSAVRGQYHFKKYIFQSGIQFDLISNAEKTLNGFNIDTGREFLLNNFQLNWHIFYLWTGISELLRETNFGTVLKHQWDHFEILLGTNFRTYAYTKKAIKHYEFDQESAVKIHENWNLMYAFSWNLKPFGNNWNLGISLTDVDHFNISQETNPLMYLHGIYRLTPKLDLFSEAWYKTAGAFNLNVNYFGFFIRTGILWDIE